MRTTEHKSFVPYEISSQRLIEELSHTVGFQPDPAKYFKKSSKGYLIHTSFSWAQLVIGIMVAFFLALMSIGLFDSPIGESVVHGLPGQTALLIRIVFAFSFSVLGFSGVFLGTIRRTSYLDTEYHRITIATSLLLFTRRHELVREDIDSVVFNRYIQKHTNLVEYLFYKPLKIGQNSVGYKSNELNEMSRSCSKPVDVGSLWSIMIQLKNGKRIPLTLKMFSDLITSRDKNRERINIENHVRNSWILAFYLGVPLQYIANDLDVIIRSPNDIPVHTLKKIDELKKKKEVIQTKSNEFVMKKVIILWLTIVLLSAVFICYKAFSYFKTNNFKNYLALPIIIQVVFIVISGMIIIKLMRNKNN